MTTWNCRPVGRSLGTHAPVWDALNRERFGAHPLLDSRFVDLLLRNFAQGDELLCFEHGASGQAPTAMCILRPTGCGVWRSFLPSQAPLGPSLLCGPVDLAGLMKALPGLVVQIDLLCLDPAYSGVMHEFPVPVEIVEHALTIAVDLREGFDSWWASRPKKLRENLGRYRRRAAAEGLEPRYTVVSEAEQVGAAVVRYAELESRGWKGKMGTAVDADSGQLAFYAELLRLFAVDGSAVVHELWFGDRLAASRLTIAQNGIVVALKTTYDESLRRVAPGRLLLYEVLRDAFERWPDHVFEFYTNATVDQVAWSTSQRQIVHLSSLRWRFVQPAKWLRERIGGAFTSGKRQVEVTVDVFTRTEDLTEDARRLMVRAEANRVCLGPAWFDNLIRTVVPAEASVELYVARRAGAAVAVLPVVVGLEDAHRLSALANYYSWLYAPALADGVGASALVPIVRAMVERHPGSWSLTFAPMVRDGLSFNALRQALKSCALPTFDFFCHGNWVQPGTSNWTDYLVARPSQLRNNIARGEKRLQARNAVVEILTSAEDTERGLRAFERVYSLSWKRPEPYPDFIPGLVRLCAARGWLRLGVVWVGETPIAAQIWIVANKRAEIYKLAYDEEYKALGAGTVLTARIMRHVMVVDEVDEVDYLIGDDSYKVQWMSERRERWGLVAYNPRTLGGLNGLAREVAGRVFRAAQRLARRRQVATAGVV